MSPETATLLRATAALVTHAQARPTDADTLTRLRKARGAAEVAWVQAGTPDLPSGAPRPTVMPEHVGKGDEDKDWSREELDVELRRATDKAFLLDAGDGAFWCPRSVVDGAEDLVNPGDMATVRVPRWVLP